MSVQKNNDKQLDKSLKALSNKQRAKAVADQKAAKKWKTYGIAAIVVAVLIVALLFWDSGIIQRRAAAVTVGERSYSAAEVDYYYYSLYDNMYAYASYYGLDVNKSLKEQEYTEGTTWYQYICDNAKTSLTNVSTLAQEAKAAGYEMDEDTKALVAEEIQKTKDSAAENNVSYSFYLKRMFGRLMTPSIYEKVLNEYEYAYAFETYKTQSFEVSDSDIQAYYDENKDSIDTYDYLCYRVNAMPEEEDEDGSEKALTKEDYTAAAKDAKELADQLLAEMKADAMEDSELVSDERVSDFSDIASGSLSNYTFGEWMVDAARKPGDATVLDQTTKVTASDNEEEVVQYYFAVVFNGRSLDEYRAASVRTILVEAHDADEIPDYTAAEAKAQELKAQFDAAGATEEAFIALTEEAEAEDEAEEADTSAEDEESGEVHTTPHFYESVRKGVLSDALEAWVYGADHTAGEVAVLEDAAGKGYQLVYFVGYDEELAWKSAARSTLQSQSYDEWMDGISENYEAKETSFFSQVG